MKAHASVCLSSLNGPLHVLNLFVLLFPLQEAENTLRMMQHKLREEERDLMRSSCEKTTNNESKTIITLNLFLFFNIFIKYFLQ